MENGSPMLSAETRLPFSAVGRARLADGTLFGLNASSMQLSTRNKMYYNSFLVSMMFFSETSIQPTVFKLMGNQVDRSEKWKSTEDGPALALRVSS